MPESLAGLVRFAVYGFNVQHYAGPAGAERLVREVDESGDIEEYVAWDGGVRARVKTRMTCYRHNGSQKPRGTVEYYGLSALIFARNWPIEVLERIEHPDGSVEYYSGEQDYERLVRTKHADGTEVHYKGRKDEERITRIKHADGSVAYYTDQKGAERKVRVKHADGAVHHFDGAKDEEHMVRAVAADGAVVHHQGQKGAERKVRAVAADGTVVHYQGRKGAEREVFDPGSCSSSACILPRGHVGLCSHWIVTSRLRSGR